MFSVGDRCCKASRLPVVETPKTPRLLLHAISADYQGSPDSEISPGRCSRCTRTSVRISPPLLPTALCRSRAGRQIFSRATLGTPPELCFRFFPLPWRGKTPAIPLCWIQSVSRQHPASRHLRSVREPSEPFYPNRRAVYRGTLRDKTFSTRRPPS